MLLPMLAGMLAGFLITFLLVRLAAISGTWLAFTSASGTVRHIIIAKDSRLQTMIQMVTSEGEKPSPEAQRSEAESQ
jgi:hypothetical protein